MTSKRPPIIVLSGPTACGKSDLALRLATMLDVEIVTADSQQVYSGLDVGTAKPTMSDRARVPHHLLDIASPGDQLTAAQFVRLADDAILAIADRGRTPLIVGGTGLWLRALLRGLVDAPSRDTVLRDELMAEEETSGAGTLHRKLSRLDPKTADRLHPNDLVRIVRALEVYELSGRTLSEHHSRHGFQTRRYPYRFFALTIERTELRSKISTRTGAMLEAGWVEEVRGLLAAGVSRTRLEKVIGYGELASHLLGELRLEEARDRIVSRTWRYAKRQLMWLRKEPQVEWLRPPVDVETVAGAAVVKKSSTGVGHLAASPGMTRESSGES